MNMGAGALLMLVFAAAAIPSRATNLPPSCGDAKTVIDVATHKHASASTAPEEGKAKVVFIETADSDAAPVTTRVAIDGAWLGGNRGNSYFESTIPPGEHHVCVDWQLNRRMIRDDPQFDVFKAQAGHVYYFRVQVGWLPSVQMILNREPGGHMSLSLSNLNQDEGQYLVRNSRLSTSAQKK